VRRVDSVDFSAFDWNEDKRLRTLASRGLDFRIVAYALRSPHIEAESPRDGEPRTKAICMFGTRLIVLIYTKRDNVCRIISAWPADRNEQRKYREILGGGDPPHGRGG